MAIAESRAVKGNSISLSLSDQRNHPSIVSLSPFEIVGGKKRVFSGKSSEVVLSPSQTHHSFPTNLCISFFVVSSFIEFRGGFLSLSPLSLSLPSV